MNFGLPNRSQNLLKRLRNRSSNQRANFRRFLLLFFLFWDLRFLENSSFPWVISHIWRFPMNSYFCYFREFFVPTIIPKTFENDVPTLPKSALKMHWFSTSLFSGLGLDFGASWASNLEPSWAQKPKLLVLDAPWEAS